ncbi:unnamed protein product [Bemisia tabaci]|uniref:F5/8 type C domain-containing protein n=1 Tax=Bemisia tabaci TaxID=7038 RepID=A0A9P0AHU7_BEMTA|nr:unnamed protein product [Bemisia tabaci]
MNPWCLQPPAAISCGSCKIMGSSRMEFELIGRRAERSEMHCGSPLGMESGEIRDQDIMASSSHDASMTGPHHGRLRHEKLGGAWCPKNVVTKTAHEYLEINLNSLHIISGTRTQGRYANGQGQEYAEEFMIEYWRPGFTSWVRWKNRNGKHVSVDLIIETCSLFLGRT